MTTSATKPSSSGGIMEVLRIALPLVLASAGHAVNLFVDRLMLTYHSETTMAAAFPAGLTAFAFSCFFVGTVGYCNAFVAQYYGAGLFRRVGVSVWQGLWVALIGGGLMALTGLAAPQIFAAFGHAPEIQELEIVYYRILAYGTVFPLLLQGLCAFWGGRGRTLMVMIVNFVITLSNIPFNLILIFGCDIEVPWVGRVTVPEMGIAGAAYGTVAAGALGCIVLGIAFFAPWNRKAYRTTRCWDWGLFKRLIRFGAPNGVQLFLDLTAFNVFVILLGKISSTALAASGIAFALNSLAFIPMLGLGQTASILVGQSVGAGDIPHAERSVRSAIVIVFYYMAVMGVVFVLYPEPVLALFKISSPEVMSATRIMLRFIAAYLLFDGLFLTYGNAVKGAGDTRFCMWAGSLMAWFLYALPCAGLYWFFQTGTAEEFFGGAAPDWCLWSLWSVCVFYIMCCGLLFFWRFRQGKWKKMRVIESDVAA